MEASPVHGHTSPFYDSLFWFGLFLPRGFYSFGIHRQTFKTLQGYHILPETFLDLVIVLGVNSMWPTLHYIHCHPASLPGPWVSKSSDWWCYLFSASIYLIKPRYIGQVLSLSLQNKQKKKKCIQHTEIPPAKLFVQKKVKDVISGSVMASAGWAFSGDDRGFLGLVNTSEGT